MVLRAIGHGCLWLFLLTLTIQVLPVQRPANAFPETWQTSQSPSVQLGVRNKMGTHKYTAVWIVSGADGSRYEVRGMVKGDDWGDVFFPYSFGPFQSPFDTPGRSQLTGNDLPPALSSSNQ